MRTSPDHAAHADADFACQGIVAQQLPLAGASKLRVVVLVARFNAAITDALYHGAVETLLKAGVEEDNIIAESVPGALELPMMADHYARQSSIDAIVTLGCVIRGETTHYEMVSDGMARGLMRVQLDHRTPVGFGVLTCETADQAIARSQPSGDGHNVGADAAAAALEVALLVHPHATR